MKKILFIAGAGRSGSTLLDITLGNMKGCFSLGELNFLVENGIIKNEFCSCGTKVLDCSFWKKIISKWNYKRKLSNETFVNVQYKLLRNKRFLINIFTKPKYYEEYLHDTEKLYEIIFKESKHNILIDSSKNGNYIKILKRINYEFEIIHLKRSFLGRYKSTRKHLKIDPIRGVEKEIKPMGLFYSFVTWAFDNFTVSFYSLGLKKTKIYYHDFIENPENVVSKLIKINKNEKKLLNNRGPLYSKHLVAGSRFRMDSKIFIKKNDL